MFKTMIGVTLALVLAACGGSAPAPTDAWRGPTDPGSNEVRAEPTPMPTTTTANR